MILTRNKEEKAIILLILMLGTLLEVSADLLYPYGTSAGDSQACSSDPGGNYAPDDPYEYNSTRGLPFFGTSYTNFYISPNGFISDTAFDGLSSGGKRKKFPFVAASSTYSNCNNTAQANCWLNYYYDTTAWEALLSSQNDSDVCVHGTTVAANFEYDNSVWDSGIFATFGTDYTFITDPAGCIASTAPTNNFPNWMIAAYWEELEVSVNSATLTYRETTDATILSMAKSDVESLSTVSTFDPQWAFVITWAYVTYPTGWQYIPIPENTMQLVIATDGTNTYGIYNFNQTQIGGGTVGFDSGDGTNYCSLVSSRTGNIKYVSTSSNVGTTGRWVLSFSSSFDKTLCEPLRTEAVSCTCDAGWTGRLCATSIDDCASNPCISIQTCVDGHLSYTCVDSAASTSGDLSTAAIVGIAVGSTAGGVSLIALVVLLAKFLNKSNSTKVEEINPGA